MNAPTRVTGFLVGVVAVFGIAYAVGGQVGAVGATADVHASDGSSGHAPPTATSRTDTRRPFRARTIPGGLMVSSGGYTLALVDSARRWAAAADRVRDRRPDGPVTAYDVEHEKRLHFIAVRRDFTGFQHVHPTLAADGTWSTDLDLTPGQWRVFADFKPSGADAVTLGADLSVPGRVAVPPQARTIRVAKVDGYTVTLTGDLVAGEHSMLDSERRQGRPAGHRPGALPRRLRAPGRAARRRPRLPARPPRGEPGDGKTEPGPGIAFGAEVPSAGSYHLYLDFKHDGVVRTAEFASRRQARPDGEHGADEHPGSTSSWTSAG